MFKKSHIHLSQNSAVESIRAGVNASLIRGNIGARLGILMGIDTIDDKRRGANQISASEELTKIRKRLREEGIQ